MKSYWMQIADDAATLALRDAPTPEPGPGQLLLRVHAAALNRGEFISGHGLHKAGVARPIGLEGAGEVVAIGTGVQRFAAGDRVFGRFPGSFAEYALIDEREAMPMPANLSWEEAASFPITYAVVYDMLVVQGHLAAGEWVLVAGVSSGVGVAAMQMAKALGAKVIGTSGSPEKLERLKALGLDVGICTRKPDFYDAVMQATAGKGVDLVVNTVGGSVFAESVRTMAFQGRLATVGYVDGMLKGEIDIEALHAKRLTLFGVSNKMRSIEQRVAAMPGFIADILPLIANGSIAPVIDRVFPFEQLDAAKAYMESNLHLGKIVVAIADTKQDEVAR
jgi:NADPH2:quinone reductase